MPYIATKDIGVENHNINYEGGLSVNDDDGFKIAKKGSSLLCIEGGSAGKKIGYLNKDVAFVNKLCCFEPKNIDSKFLFYSLQSPDFLSDFYLNLTGMIGGVNVGDAKNLVVCFPNNADEQKKIVSFLDKRISQIDSLMSNQEKQIKKIEEYRQTIIDRAFDDCQKIKLKFVSSGIADGTHGTFRRIDDGELLLSAKNLGEDQLIISSNESCISSDDYYSIIKCGFPKKNDILMCCVGDVGKTIMYNTDEIYAFQRSVMFIRPSSKILPEFLLYGLRTTDVIVQETRLANKTIQSGLYQGLVKELFIPYFENVDDQRKILFAIKSKLNKLNRLLNIKQKKIIFLKHYKKSLIYEYVAGEKRVSL